MYKLLLILKYLRRKLVPMFAALAVMLCTAMVIIVISVMGGFLEMLRGASHRLEGDVSIYTYDVNGFPDYEEMLKGLRGLPDIKAATPMIVTLGLLTVDQRVLEKEVVGIEPESLDAVTPLRDSLYWNAQNISQDMRDSMTARYGKDMAEWPAGARQRLEVFAKADFRDSAMKFKLPAAWDEGLSGMIPGVAVSPFAQRDTKGNLHVDGSLLMQKMTLTVIPISHKGVAIAPTYKQFEVVNEFKSGLFEIDNMRVYVPLGVLQKMLKLDAYPEVGEDMKPTGRMISGRVTGIMVRGREGKDLGALQAEVGEYVSRFEADHPDIPPLNVSTWVELHETFLGAVEKEKGLLTVLFAFISVVAVAMIAVIFYMIVLEKTRDIGVLRAIGASRWGIMAIFLGYGLAIGTLGAGLGLALAASIVWNLNEIQDLLYKMFGFKMWDPAIYYFDRIPSHLNPQEVTVIMIVAALSGILGSLLPAYLAGRQNPVEALRYE